MAGTSPTSNRSTYGMRRNQHGGFCWFSSVVACSPATSKTLFARTEWHGYYQPRRNVLRFCGRFLLPVFWCSAYYAHCLTCERCLLWNNKCELVADIIDHRTPMLKNIKRTRSQNDRGSPTSWWSRGRKVATFCPSALNKHGSHNPPQDENQQRTKRCFPS